MQAHGIVQLVSARLQLIPDDLTFGRRTKFRTQARWIAVHLLRRTGRYSLSDIARIMHYRDHTSVAHALRVLHQRMERDLYLRDEIHALEVELDTTTHWGARPAPPEGQP